MGLDYYIVKFGRNGKDKERKIDLMEDSDDQMKLNLDLDLLYVHIHIPL